MNSTPKPCKHYAERMARNLSEIAPCNAECAATHYGGFGCAACFIGELIVAFMEIGNTSTDTLTDTSTGGKKDK